MGTGCPVRVGEQYQVEAVRLNDDGDGVTTVNGFTVFVPLLLPGEQATVAITEVHPRFARACVVDARNPAGQRTTPRCAVFGACGGCQLQHLDYASQLQHKRSVVANALTRIGKFKDIEVLPTLGMEHPWRYRNQMQIALRFDAESGIIRQGFFTHGSHDLVDTAECHLEPIEMERTAALAVDIIQRTLGTRAAGVHHLIIRQSITTGDQMLVLAVQSETVVQRATIAALLDIPRVISVAYTVQPSAHGPVWGPTTTVAAGAIHLRERIDPLEFLISPRSFFQVNTLQARRLYELALAYAAPSADDTVLDAYCGTGTLGLLLATRSRSVVGIESVAAAVTDARLNARHNALHNAEFMVGEVERVLPRLVGSGQHFDIVVVDPPRKGCQPQVLEALLAARPRKLVYVSCNPATMARDLRILADGGYDISVVQPVDMFPQTSHVECVVSAHRVD